MNQVILPRCAVDGGIELTSTKDVTVHFGDGKEVTPDSVLIYSTPELYNLFKEIFMLITHEVAAGSAPAVFPTLAGIRDDSVGLALAYPGVQLSRLLLTTGLPTTTLRKIAEDVCAALAYLHKFDIYHCNINTDALFWDAEANRTVLGGFEDATWQRGPAVSKAPMTYYSPPETLLHLYGDFGPRDMWAYAATMYGVCVRELPYGKQGDSVRVVLDFMKTETSPRFLRLIGQPLRYVIKNCLRLDPGRRMCSPQAATYLKEH